MDGFDKKPWVWWYLLLCCVFAQSRLRLRLDLDPGAFGHETRGVSCSASIISAVFSGPLNPIPSFFPRTLAVIALVIPCQTQSQHQHARTHAHIHNE